MSRRKPPKTPTDKLLYMHRSKYTDGTVYEGRLYKRKHDALPRSVPDNDQSELVIYKLVEVAVIPTRVALGKGSMIRLKGKAGQTTELKEAIDAVG